MRSRLSSLGALIVLLAAVSIGLAQVGPSTATPPSPVTLPSPATPPATVAPQMPATPAAPAVASPVSGIRNKLAAGDLLSAESVLEVYRAKSGEDGPWLAGLSWLARGALLVGDTAKAGRYAAQVRSQCAERVLRGADVTKDHDLEIALGAAIEVKAQLVERAAGARAAATILRGELEDLKGPMTLRARLNKRLNMLALAGATAPELEVEEYIGEKPPSLASLRGKPVLLFLWFEGCGDCKAQEEALARVASEYGPRGLQVVTLTRYYDGDTSRVQEKARIDSVWKAVYSGVGTVPIVISTASVERYGGSSTPTFVFIDRAGIVRRYTPTRLTLDELRKTIDPLME